MTSAAVLDIEGLTVEFRGDHGTVRAVDQVSLALHPGEVLGLVGESGSGKSTIALAALGLLPRAGHVVAGRARIEGRELLDMGAAERRALRGRRVGMVFQDPMTSLTPWLGVGRQLTEGMQEHLGLDRRTAEARAVSLLEQVGIPTPALRLQDFPHQFSGGQRQRILIAMALACDPVLLIADEPTTALDVTVQAQVLGVLRRLQRERGLATLLVTHDMGVVAAVCDRVAVLYRGRLVELRPVDELFAAPQHPYTRGLLGAVPRLDSVRGTHLATVDHEAIAREVAQP